MTTFAEDMAWQERFRSHFAEIATGVIRVQVASWIDDTKRNTDFMVATLNNGTRMAARSRRRDARFGRYRREFTIRARRPSGAKTELAKIRDGLGDFMAYGFEAEPDSDRLDPWLLLNLALLREYLDGDGRWSLQVNDDGTEFAAFAVAEMPLGCVLNSEGHIMISSTSTPCLICGRPAFGCTLHVCCETNGRRHPGAPCDACRTSDALNNYRYGWPS